MAGRSRAQAAKNNAQLEDQTWKKFADCDYCGRTIMVNNYQDRKSRTPRFLGLIICPWCDPRHTEDRWDWMMGTGGDKPRITNLDLYRTIISTYLIRIMVKGFSPDKVLIKAQELWDYDGKPKTRKEE